jgi:NAD(P)-dependent dehydrogenase (short-subunit alcohol dehydrogenase family)
MPGNLPGNLVHNVAKAAVMRLSQNLAVELSPYHIRVNSISPGVIDTPALRPILGSEPDSPVRKEFIKPTLIPRIGRPEDIAYAALYLASEESSYVTGINLIVDGGWSASGGIGRPKPETQDALGEMVVHLFRSGEP